MLSPVKAPILKLIIKTLVGINPQQSHWVGVGLRKQHYTHLESSPATGIDFFELLTENHIDSQGRPRQIAFQIAQNYPVTLHGVSLNIAGQVLNREYLKNLKAFADQLQPVWISDHLCWTGSGATNTHNLLPFAWTQTSLQHLVSQIQTVQSLLGRQLVLENISAYVQFKDSKMTEAEFLSQLCQQSGCLLLLDINNLYVNASNYHFDPLAFLKSLPASSIAQYHLAGYAEHPGFLFDSHSQAVWPAVWELYQHALQIIGPRPTLIEWDENVPEFAILAAEAFKAKNYLRACV